MSAQRFVARPVEIEAVEWRGDLLGIPERWRALDMFTTDDGHLVVRTNRGPAPAYVGDWIVKGRSGEFYPVDPAVFADKYEALTDE